MVNTRRKLQLNEPISKRIMSLNPCGTSDEQRRLGRVSEPVVYNSDVDGLLGCHTGLAGTTAQRKQDIIFWFRAATLDREVNI